MNEKTVYRIKERLIIDTESRCIYDTSIDSQPIELTKQLFDILLYLCENAGIVLTYDQILSYIAPDDYVGGKETLITQINRLKKVIKNSFGKEFANSVIKNRRDFGYIIERDIIRIEEITPNLPDSPEPASVESPPDESNIFKGMPFTFAVFYSLIVIDNTPMKMKYETVRFLLTGKEYYSKTSTFDEYFTDDNIRLYLHGELDLPNTMIESIIAPGAEVFVNRVLRLKIFEIGKRKTYIEKMFKDQWFSTDNQHLLELYSDATKSQSDDRFVANLLLYSVQEKRRLNSLIVKIILRTFQKSIEGS